MRSFLAIELFTFSKIQNFISIAQESSQCFGYINYIPQVERSL